MRNIYLYILGVGLFLGGCSSDADPAQEENELTPLSFMASGVEVSTSSRTVGNAFPNSGSVTILATESTSTTVATNWSELYLNHISATAAVEDGNGKHPLSVTDTYYWPFEANKYLSFAAYNPSSNASLTHSGTILNVSAPFFDLLTIEPVGAYSKTHGTVDLGAFQHRMARVMVNVIPVDKSGNVIADADYKNDLLKITGLKIKTKQTKASWDLAKPLDQQMTLGEADNDFSTLYTLVDNANVIVLPYRSTAMDYYLLPTTDLSTSQISLTMIDGEGGVLTSHYDEPLNLFTTAKLEAGKTTLLTIYVKSMKVNTGDTNDIILKGTLTDWEYKGAGTLDIE